MLASAHNSKTPMLQPMGFAEILDTTFSLYRKHFWLFLRIIAVYFGLSLLQASAFKFLLNDSPDFLTLVANWVIIAFAGGGVVTASSALYLNGHTTMRATWCQLGNKFFSYFGCFLPWGFVALMSLSCTARFFQRPFRAGLVSFLLCIFPLVFYFTIAWSFWGFAILIEGKSVPNALKRSRELVKGTWWRVCGITLAIYLLGVTIFLILIFSWDTLIWLTNPTDIENPMASIQEFFSDEPQEDIDLLADVEGILLWLVIRTFIAFVFPIMVIGSMLLYFDLRIRKEAFDLEMIIRNNAAEQRDSVLK